LRSSFIMGIVRPEDRGAAAGITTLSRHVPVAVSPTLSAYLMQSFSLNVPIFIGGSLQLFHDCVFSSFATCDPRRKKAFEPKTCYLHWRIWLSMTVAVDNPG
jgi:hypothetical protein